MQGGFKCLYKLIFAGVAALYPKVSALGIRIKSEKSQEIRLGDGRENLNPLINTMITNEKTRLKVV